MEQIRRISYLTSQYI